MRLSVLIVNWNTREMLRACLASVYEEDLDDAEVIVVDNASSDSSAAMAREAFPQAILVENTENLGFALANNQAMRMARGELILLLNPDTVVHRGAFAAAVRHLREHADIGVLGCRQVEADGRDQESCGLFPSLPTMLLQNVTNALLGFGKEGAARRLATATGLRWMPLKRMRPFWDFGKTQDVDWVMGAFLLVRREALAGEELFDGRFVMYGEDIDLCRRVRRRGWRVVYFAGASILHYGGASSKETPALADAAHFVGTVRFYQKHNGLLQTLLYRLLLFAGSLVALGASSRNRRLAALYKMRVALVPTYRGLVKRASR